MPCRMSTLAAAALGAGAAAAAGAAGAAAFAALPAARASAGEAAIARPGAARGGAAPGGSARSAAGTAASAALASAGAVAALAAAGRGRGGRDRALVKARVYNEGLDLVYEKYPEDEYGECKGPKVLQGYGGPFPTDCWDPAGLTKGKSDEELLYYRAAEIKHGRVAMLACLGWFHTASGWHPIGDAAARTVVSDNPLIAAEQTPLGAWLQVFFSLMVIEWLVAYVTKPPAEKPWDLVGWSSVIRDEEYSEWKRSQLMEINNGRLAMFGIIGLIAQDLYTGTYFEEIKNICLLRLGVPDNPYVCKVPGQENWFTAPLNPKMVLDGVSDLYPQALDPRQVQYAADIAAGRL